MRVDLSPRSRSGGRCTRRRLSPSPGAPSPGVLPGQPEEAQARPAGDTALVDRASPVVGHRHVDPRVIGPEARRPDHRATSSAPPSANRTVASPASTARPWSCTPCRRRSFRGLEPTSVSRPAIRSPSCDSVDARMRPVLSKNQNRSRPSSRLRRTAIGQSSVAIGAAACSRRPRPGRCVHAHR